MNEFFTTAVYQPVYNLIVFFANLFPVANFSLAIIATTVVIKLLFLSLSKQQIESQKKTSRAPTEDKGDTGKI